MRFTSTLQDHAELDVALDRALAAVRDGLDGGSPNLVVMFVSPHHAPGWEALPRRVRAAFPGVALVGCSGGGVIGDGREVEDTPALSLTAAVLPDVAIKPFHVTNAEVVELRASPGRWHERLGVLPEHQPGFVVLPDPFTVDAEALMRSLDAAYPGVAKVGGLVSGARRATENRLFLGDRSLDRGAVGVAMWGDVQVDALVAQGCRPIGDPLVVTRAERNLVYELDGEPVVEVLDALYTALPARDQQLFRGSPHIGVVMDPSIDKPRPGDFLVRNLLGLDRERGVIAVGHVLEPRQVVQFHVRDAEASRADLTDLLDRRRREGVAPDGALLFSCLGRGRRFYGEADHDSRLLRDKLGPVPVGGFFCSGEIGPVHARTYLHGYTSSFGLFRPRGWD